MIRLRSYAATAGQALRPFENLRFAPSEVEGRLASLAQGRARLSFVVACTVAFIVTGGSRNVLACPMCFGAEETSMIEGTKLGVLVMLAIILAVQGAFVGFFVYLHKRAKRIAEIDLDTEWSELQGASRTP